MNNTSIKVALSLAVVSMVAMMSFTSCEYSNVPSGPKESKIKYDSVRIDESSLAAYVPEDVKGQYVSVRTALSIGSKLSDGDKTTKMYYIAGVVSKCEMTKYNVFAFNIHDNDNTATSFYMFGGKGVDSKGTIDANNVKVGDTVIVKVQITNFGGTIENYNKGGLVYATTNEDAYPKTEVVKWTFKKSFCDWTVDVKQNPGFDLWTAAATAVQASGQNSSVNYAGEAWLISPVVNLKEKGLAKPKLNIAHYHLTRGADMVPANYLKMFVSTDGATWQQVAIPAYTDDDKGLAIDAILDLKKYNDCENFRIAFDYISTENCASKWCIKEVKIYEVKR